ncbi:MAG: gamma-glutamyltransferase [Planctomycetota bacterium]|nr:gamma-glutamyltransferase [Planctomycetota bacterium]
MHRGACASADDHSAEAGAALLAAGGNAVDAAIGAGLMACVTLPTMTSLGGGGILTLLRAGQVYVCDFFAALPGLAARRHGARELDVVTVVFDGIPIDFHVRAPSIAVPGTVAGLWEVHRRFGRMPLAEVAAPAIAAARAGYIAGEAQTRAFQLLDEIFRMSPETWALVSNGAQVVQPGERLCLPNLADTIERLVAEGAGAFYMGDVAEAIVTAADDWVTPEDLAAYKPRFREPLRGSYRGWTVHAPAMPSVTGPIVLAGLRLLEAGGELPRPLDVTAWRRIADAMEQGAALRTPEYEARLFEPGWLQGVLAGTPGGNTMQVSTADAEGTLVSYTTTVGESAGITAPGTGVVLNNFLGEEDILPVGAQREPGRRMMTSMCPMILEHGAGRRIALGSAGSARIKTAILQVIVQLLDAGLAPAEAVAAARVHTDAGRLYVEAHGRSRAEIEALRALRPNVEVVEPCGFYFGGAQVVEWTAEVARAGADEARRYCAARVV